MPSPFPGVIFDKATFYPGGRMTQSLSVGYASATFGTAVIATPWRLFKSVRFTHPLKLLK
jgi:hypothetical protein